MKKIIIFSLIICIAVGIPLIKKLSQDENLQGVEVEQVSMQTIRASILASGQFKYELEVNLTAEVIGKVRKLYVDEGERVIKGQLLLEIDDQTFVAAVEQQEAVVVHQELAIERQKLVVNNLQLQLQRKTKLFKQKLFDKESYESVINAYELSRVDLKSSYELLKQVRAGLDQAKEQLSKTKVISPIEGTITTLNIKEGETAISGTTNISGSSLMTIADPNTMLAEINVDEADIANVEINQKVEVIAIAFADNSIVGTVQSIASTAKAARGRQNLSFAVKLKLQFEDRNNLVNLRPGMSCRAEVFTQGEKKLLAVPVKAIQTEEDHDNDLVKNYVYILEGQSVQKVRVSTGISDDSFQQIIKGLEQGITIITGPNKILRHLKDGDRVSVADTQMTHSSIDKD